MKAIYLLSIRLKLNSSAILRLKFEVSFHYYLIQTNRLLITIVREFLSNLVSFPQNHILILDFPLF